MNNNHYLLGGNYMGKRILYVLLLVLGVVGFACCITAIFAVWITHSRFERASDNVVGAVDNSVAAVNERLSQTQDRVRRLKITTEEITQSVKDWTKLEARDRLASRLEVEDKAERLVSGLQQADQLLEFTESSIHLLQRALELVSATGITIEVESPERLLEEVSALRLQLAQAIEPVEGIRERATEASNESLRDERWNQIVELSIRVLATFTSIDSRIGNLSDRLSQMPTHTRSAQTTLLWWTQAAAIGITLLICWMAAGQGALCFLGWKGSAIRQNQHPRTDNIGHSVSDP